MNRFALVTVASLPTTARLGPPESERNGYELNPKTPALDLYADLVIVKKASQTVALQLPGVISQQINRKNPLWEKLVDREVAEINRRSNLLKYIGEKVEAAKPRKVPKKT